MTFLAAAAVPLTALALVGLSSAGSDASASAASLKTVSAAGKQVSKAPSNSSSGTGY